MKVAIVGINYSPELTGIAVYTAGMAEYFVSKGITVTVYAGFPYYPMWAKGKTDRERLFRVDCLNSVEVRRSYLYVPARPSALKRILHELSFVISVSVSYMFGPKADCTVIVSPPLFLGIPIALIAKLKRSKTIFHVQDLQPDAAVDLGMLKKGCLTGFLFFVERMTYRLVDKVTTISAGMMRKITDKGIPKEKVFLFLNWANDDHIIPLDTSTQYRRDLSLDDKFVVLYSGNMGVKQGLGVLLDAARQLGAVSGIVFLIVGDGGEKMTLQQRAEEMQLKNVRFLPVQPYDQLGMLLATADVSVIPQKRGVNDIVLPSKLSNIMASQRPLIASSPSSSDLGKIIIESESGLLVEAGNAGQLAEAILFLYRHPEERDRMGRNGRAYMGEKLARQPILEEFTRLLSA